MKMTRLFRAALLLILLPGLALAGGFSGEGFGGPGGFYQYLFVPIPPVSTGLITPIFSVFPPSTTGVNPNWGGLSGAAANSSITITQTRKVPIPVDGTIFAGAFGLATVQTAGTNIVINLNGKNGHTGCIYTTITPFHCNYTGTGDHVSAGTLAEWHLRTATGSWNATGGPAQTSFLFQADLGQTGPLIAQATSVTFGSTTLYEGIGAPQINAVTEALTSNLQPNAPGQLAGIYCYPNASDVLAGVTHSCTVMLNGVATALTCAGNASTPTLGCCANVGGTGNIGGASAAPCSAISAITIAPGDTLSIKVQCGNGTTDTCATIVPGMSVIWNPTNAGQVPIYQATVTPSNSTPWFASAMDAGFNSTSPTNWNFTPSQGTLTFSNLLACTVATVTTGSWKWQFQYSNSLTAPGTNSALVTSFSGPSGTTCPYTGVPSRIMNSGSQDTTDTQPIGPGGTIGFNLVPTGTPTVASRFKSSMVVTVTIP